MNDDDIVIERRKPGRRSLRDAGIPFRRVNAIVCNGRLVDVFDALCFLEGRRPHELVHDVMREYLDRMADVPEVRKAMMAPRRRRLRLVERAEGTGGDTDG